MELSKNKRWSSMNKKEQNAVLNLGWTSDNWDNPTIRGNMVLNKPWICLTTNEKKSAKILSYSSDDFASHIEFIVLLVSNNKVTDIYNYLPCYTISQLKEICKFYKVKGYSYFNSKLNLLNYVISKIIPQNYIKLKSIDEFKTFNYNDIELILTAKYLNDLNIRVDDLLITGVNPDTSMVSEKTDQWGPWTEKPIFNNLSLAVEPGVGWWDKVVEEHPELVDTSNLEDEVGWYAKRLQSHYLGLVRVHREINLPLEIYILLNKINRKFIHDFYVECQPIYNEYLKSIYEIYKNNYIKKHNTFNDKILFHGTDKNNVNSILNDDFSLTINNKHGARFGKGIYFADNISLAMKYSELYKNKKYVFVCKVNVGNICLGFHGMDRLTVDNNGNQYDTAVDHIDNPQQYVKFKNHQYLIIGLLEIDIFNQFSSFYYPKSKVHYNGNIKSIQRGRINSLKSTLIINYNGKKHKLYWIKNPTLKQYNVFDYVIPPPSTGTRGRGRPMALLNNLKLMYSTRISTTKNAKFIIVNTNNRIIKVITVNSSRTVIDL